nr:GGDEF domain-containing protein [Parazoarcus communis]
MLINEHIIIALKRLAERDPLTNVFNRRSFLVLLDKAVSQCQRNHASLPVLVIDLDHFKKINDTWGHRSGDSALSHFVELAAGCLRNSDVIGRLGGEEFAIFLPGTALNDALNVAERLRGLVESRTVSSGSGEIPLTISVGIAMHLRGEAPELTLHRADEAMYQAKRNGRNRVEIAPETITDRATS